MFDKPAKTTDELVQLIHDRGFVADKAGNVEAAIRRVNYYRLSAYMKSFEQTDSHEGSKVDRVPFHEVIALYDFDFELRTLAQRSIQKLEIALRRSIATHLAASYGAFPHLNPAIFAERTTWAKTHIKMLEEYSRSTEQFASHHQQKYPELQLPPIWVMVELLSLGSLVQLYKNLKARQDRLQIARDFGLDEAVLVSWLDQFVQVRNICAHHGRLWNRLLHRAAKVPSHISPAHKKLLTFEGKGSKNVLNVFVILDYLEVTMFQESSVIREVCRLSRALNQHSSRVSFIRRERLQVFESMVESGA